jgi:hypothetical protein
MSAKHSKADIDPARPRAYREFMSTRPSDRDHIAG